MAKVESAAAFQARDISPGVFHLLCMDCVWKVCFSKLPSNFRSSNLFSETSLRCCWHSWLRRRARAPASCCKVFLSWHSPGCVPLILSPLHAKALLSGSLRGNGISSTLLAVIPFSLDRVSPRQAPSVSSPRGAVFFPSCKSRGFRHQGLMPGFSSSSLTLTLSHPLHFGTFSHLVIQAAHRIKSLFSKGGEPL